MYIYFIKAAYSLQNIILEDYVNIAADMPEENLPQQPEVINNEKSAQEENYAEILSARNTVLNQQQNQHNLKKYMPQTIFVYTFPFSVSEWVSELHDNFSQL